MMMKEKERGKKKETETLLISSIFEEKSATRIARQKKDRICP